MAKEKEKENDGLEYAILNGNESELWEMDYVSYTEWRY